MQIREKSPFIPLLVPSSPRITFMEDMICCAAGGDIDVAYR